MLLRRRTEPEVQPAPLPPTEPEPAASGPTHPAFWTPVAGTDVACCCPAAPMVQLVLARPDGRPPVELLLCGHHYRISADALTTGGATAYDVDGMPLQAAPWR